MGGDNGQENAKVGSWLEKLAYFRQGFRNPSRERRFRSQAKVRPWVKSCAGMVPALEWEPV